MHRVYCKDCQWLELPENEGSEGCWKCLHDSNVNIVYNSTWFESVEIVTYKQTPEIKNALNNCRFFKFILKEGLKKHQENSGHLN